MTDIHRASARRARRIAAHFLPAIMLACVRRGLTGQDETARKCREHLLKTPLAEPDDQPRNQTQDPCRIQFSRAYDDLSPETKAVVDEEYRVLCAEHAAAAAQREDPAAGRIRRAREFVARHLPALTLEHVKGALTGEPEIARRCSRFLVSTSLPRTAGDNHDQLPNLPAPLFMLLKPETRDRMIKELRPDRTPPASQQVGLAASAASCQPSADRSHTRTSRPSA